jgi:hypothetical protein
MSGPKSLSHCSRCGRRTLSELTFHEAIFMRAFYPAQLW